MSSVSASKPLGNRIFDEMPEPEIVRNAAAFLCGDHEQSIANTGVVCRNWRDNQVLQNERRHLRNRTEMQRQLFVERSFPSALRSVLAKNKMPIYKLPKL